MANILTERTGAESAVVVDTDVISMLFKRDSRAAPYINLLINLPLVSSFMTYAELYQWARFRNWGQRKINELEDFLQDYAIVMASENLCQVWADVRAECRSKGRPISAQDAWHAALALQYDIPLVTNNVNDFSIIENLTILTSSSQPG